MDFAPNFKQRLAHCLLQLPENWDALHLGGYSPHGELINYSSLLVKCNKSWGGYGYIVNKRAYQKLINLLDGAQTQVDTYYTWVMSEMNWYKTREMLVYHLAGYSDINQEYRDIKDLYK